MARVKLDRIAKEKDEYTAILVGSSQSYRGFDPTIFDQRLAEAGVPSHSFNLAMPGAQMAETYEYLKSVSALEPANLRWVFIEAEWITKLSDQEEYLTVKNIAWRTPETTALLIPFYWLYDVPLDTKLGVCWRSLVALVYHVLGIGRGVPWVEEALGVGASELDVRNWLGSEGNGYQRLEHVKGPNARRRQFNTPKQKANAAAAIRARSTRRLREGHSAPEAEIFFRRIENLVRSMGAEPVFYTFNGDFVRSDAVALQRAGKLDNLLRFDDPVRFPELWDVEYRYDKSHYNREGAVAFTNDFADEFLRRWPGDSQ